jgi:hypothetical protein
MKQRLFVVTLLRRHKMHRTTPIFFLTYSWANLVYFYARITKTLLEMSQRSPLSLENYPCDVGKKNSKMFNSLRNSAWRMASVQL